MRTETFYFCAGRIKSVCRSCGTVFYRPSDEWVYRIGPENCRKWYCSYSCMMRAKAKLEARKQQSEEKGTPSTFFYTQEEKDELFRLYEVEKWSFTRIAEKLGRSKSYVYDMIVKKYGKYQKIKERGNT